MEQPEEIRQLGLNGRKHAMEHFELNEITARLVAFYKELRRG
jgi:glycosyltransferase involved in cell wall biosynthesis